MRDNGRLEISVKPGPNATRIEIVFAPTRSSLSFLRAKGIDFEALGVKVIPSKYGPMLTIITEKPLPETSFIVELQTMGEPTYQLGEAQTNPSVDAAAVEDPSEAIAQAWKDLYKLRAEESDRDYRLFFELDRRSTNPFRKIAEDAVYHATLGTELPLGILPEFTDPANGQKGAHLLDDLLTNRLTTVLEYRRDLRLADTDFNDPTVQKLPAEYDPADWAVVKNWFRDCLAAAHADRLAPQDVDTDAGRDIFRNALQRFAYGELRREYTLPGVNELSIGGEPDSANIFYFGEAGLILHEEQIDPKLFDVDVLVTTLRMQAIYMTRVRPASSMTTYGSPTANVGRDARPVQLRDIEWEWAVRDLPDSASGPNALDFAAVQTRMTEHVQRLAKVP